MSKAFEIKKKLLELSKVDPTLVAAGVEIWDSAYQGASRPRRLIWFGEIAWEGVDGVTVGGRPGGQRDETFNIRFAIEIHDGDEFQTEANDKAEDYLNALEEMIQDHRVIGIPGIGILRIVPVGLGEGQQGTTGRAALLAAQVHVRVRN